MFVFQSTRETRTGCKLHLQALTTITTIGMPPYTHFAAFFRHTAPLTDGFVWESTTARHFLPHLIG
jgi:hypothetical protein